MGLQIKDQGLLVHVQLEEGVTIFRSARAAQTWGPRERDVRVVDQTGKDHYYSDATIIRVIDEKHLTPAGAEKGVIHAPSS